MIERQYRTRDNLTLYYRDYLCAQAVGLLPIICLPGLTRNSRDFTELAGHLSQSRRVLCPDLRGRGFSEWDTNFQNYMPATYLSDVLELLQVEEISSVHIIGTSLGGILAMMMAVSNLPILASVVLNDIGPELDPRGLERIRAYTGKLDPVDSWQDAVTQSKAVYGQAFQGLSEQQWLAWAQCSYREDEQGNVQLDMDPKIGEAIRSAEPVNENPWDAYSALAGVPCLAIRGELSDLLSAATFNRMLREKSDLKQLSVAHRGHTPMLNEPGVIETLDEFYTGLP